jgi:hypothetical protein
MRKKIIGVLLTAIIWLGFGFVSASRVSEIIQYHFQFSSINWVKSNKIDNKDITTDIWYLLKQCESYLTTNVTSLLDNESTRRKNLNAYIADWTSLVRALWYQKNKLNIQLQNTATKIQSCQNQLTSANERYIESLKTKNELSFNRAVDKAKSARKCIWEEQVSQSAIKSLLDQVQNYFSKIERRNSYLKSNQSLIIRHYDVLKSSLLKELYPIAVELES